MNTDRAHCIAVLVLGALLMGYAYYFVDALIDNIANAVLGVYDNTMWYLAGIATVVSTGFLFLFWKRI